MSRKKILYVDDEKENLSTLKRVLRGHYDVETASSGGDALGMLDDEVFSVIVADQRMPKMTGVEFLKKASKENPDHLGIILTAYSDMDALVDAVNAGVVYRYLTKPYRQEVLKQAIDQAFERIELLAENKRLVEELKQANQFLKTEINGQFDFSILAGATKGLEEVTKLVKKVAPTQSTVLIRGESGVGKELVARAIHESSTRKDKPFHKVNCAALAEGLLESELFGHEKGAFSGAISRRIGRFEAANGGTLFLDEIGDISPKMQIGLLRLLQERTLERVGGNETIQVDVRLIAATHQNLERKSKEGKFREDLYYRLNVFPVLIPPLRDRMGDMDLLLERLMGIVSKRTGLPPKKITPEALKKLKSYDWPGNVRELENLLERALILAADDVITEEEFSLGAGIDAPMGVTSPTKNLDREQIEEAIQAANGNKLEAARILGIKRPTLYYHLKRLGIS